MQNAIVLKMESVRQPEIERALKARGLSWNGVAHVCATNSLSRGIMDTHAIGVSITKLIDLILAPIDNHHSVSLDLFPSAARFTQSRQQYRSEVEAWDRAVNARLITQRVAFDDAVYGYYLDAKENKHILKSLYDSRSVFAGTVYSLNASGVDPFEITPNSPMSTLATEVWRHLEEVIPSLSHVRKNLWIDLDTEYIQQRTPEAVRLRESIHRALKHVFGAVIGPRTIVHHGFYFYTPVQWALFQLLDATPGIRQIFVTHDNADSPVFEIWRKFFQEKWGFPAAEVFTSEEPIKKGALALFDALKGAPVNAESLQNRVKLLECRNAPEFVVHVDYHAKLATMDAESATVEIPMLYAADSKTVNRLFDRLSGGAASGQVNLAKLPIGSFLLRVHECIRVNRLDKVEYSLRPDAYRDIIASGYLLIDGKSTESLLPAVRRALPYFQRCTSLETWIARAQKLEELVRGVVYRGITQVHNQRTNRLEQIHTKAANPLVLLEWLDISVEEAKLIHKSLVVLHSLLRSIASTERVSLRDYFRTIIPHLQQGMKALDATDRTIIEEKIQGMTYSPTEEVYVVSLTDLVAMLVGRSVEFDSLGESVNEEMRFRPIRSLDVLGFKETSYALHIANLYDGVFPTRVRTIGWPFSATDLTEALTLSAQQLLELGEQCTPMGDIYLLWLALNGSESDVTLSWMNELSGEHLNKSTLVELLARPQLPAKMQTVVRKIGGIAIEPSTRPSYGQPLFTGPVHAPLDQTVVQRAQQGLQSLHRHVLSANDVCERRMVLQWILGVSPAYRAGHLQSMLYGNISGIGHRTRRWETRTLHEIGVMYTTGQRRSAEASASVKPAGPTAHDSIVYTISGRREGTDRLSLGYRRAKGDTLGIPTINSTPSFLPAKSEGVTSKICEYCPVRNACAVADYDDED